MVKRPKAAVERHAVKESFVYIKVPASFRRATIAFGPQLKTTLCLGLKDTAYISPVLGDVDTEAAQESLRLTLDRLLDLSGRPVNLAACDLHPDYTTTRIAEEWCRDNQVPLIRVQHHHAHLAACLADNGETGPAIGLCFDGTGYGTDRSVWGGEVLVGNARDFRRAGHLQSIPMPGGERAATEPWRMALAWLQESFGERLYDLRLQLLDDITARIGRKGLNVLLNRQLSDRLFPRTSSLGRLFDAAAALIFFGVEQQTQGQAAMQLERLASPSPAEPYLIELIETETALILSPVPMFRELVADLHSGISAGTIARRFHETIAEGFTRLCQKIRETSGHNTVALSGGCFQNSFLTDRLSQRLSSAGFRVLQHRQIPVHDAGISLGQAVVANAQMD